METVPELRPLPANDPLVTINAVEAAVAIRDGSAEVSALDLVIRGIRIVAVRHGVDFEIRKPVI